MCMYCLYLLVFVYMHFQHFCDSDFLSSKSFQNALAQVNYKSFLAG